MAIIKRGSFQNCKKSLPKNDTYKYVYRYLNNDKQIIYAALLPKYRFRAYYDNEKEAAKAIDLFLIGKGLQPVNVLVKK